MYIFYIMTFLLNILFQQHNLIFRNLSTLKRTEDAIMSNIGRTHVIQAGFGLSTTKFHYNYYKVKFIDVSTITKYIITKHSILF